MNTMGVLLLAAATAGGIGSPHAGGFGLIRHHAVANGPAPPGGPIVTGANGGQAGLANGRRFASVRSQIFFVDPPGMKIGWQSSGPNGEKIYLPAQLTVPARYNFMQGYIYRLKLTDIPGRAGLTLYPTIEVAPSTPATDAYLAHNPIPAQFTEEDFDQVQAGNFVTKVVYLPDPKYQELAIAGVETLVSTRLEPGIDPIREADRRGTILLIIRLGAIDLEMPSAGGPLGPGQPMVVPGAPSTVVAPGALPPNMVPPGAMIIPSPTLTPGVPVDRAPAPPAAPTTSPFVPAAPTAPVSPAPAPPNPPAATTPETPAPAAPAPETNLPAATPAETPTPAPAPGPQV
jgi:hypothetical protein